MEPAVSEFAMLASIASIAFLAALAQGATGFGFAIIALPFLLLIMGSLEAVGLTIILNLLVSLVLLPGLWRLAPKKTLAWLSMGSMVGFPVGLVIFLQASLDWVRLAVGLIILGFAAWQGLRLWRPGTTQPTDEQTSEQTWGNWPAAVVGAISGVMATALAMPGPSVMLYLSARAMTKDAVRATTLCLFALSYGAALALQAGVGVIGNQTWLVAAVAALPTVAGAKIGNYLSKYLNEALFRVIILAILLITGAYTSIIAIMNW
ncbi:MAG: sulfite exporter TauE/SafE family protein [Rhodospirillaceae bacterium]|jgi:uncharacterized membrane protein YfcA|nr:sulfite exporter TauE/SafE family protein [Rhodospirillaceae bacterium]MBT4042892.1 sulfite exporter TauE/SafE family protein [Rhodospirillaceae bacterium]MBT4688021.1 sulfite exporter TauE/SafE family protein [Rhodospirillaceae bacterium]MBT5083465.1 sulfite exporter TauE/SafE family protein [Rhodospirillaceae bacterium]MBT5527264.1 sulfite exporter TauE/SafE family protein [Rhodospirillaceae bacterium]